MSEETNPTAETDPENVTLDTEAREIIRDGIRDSAKVLDSAKDLVADRICIAFDATGFERVGMLVAAREVGAPPPALPRVDQYGSGYALEAFGMKIPLEAEEFLSLRASIREKFMRQSVESFAHVMENELRANDHKGGWINDTANSLLVRLVQEVGELAEALDLGCPAEMVRKEAADVANFAMMIAEVAFVTAMGRELEPAGRLAGVVNLDKEPTTAEIDGLKAALASGHSVTKLRSCNRHADCDAAEKQAEENGMPERYGAGTPRVDHCHDDDCEDCFGK